ncbi:vacuolar protein sorting-associated protein 26 [Rozella allomycis CSF55]|uniref:Vacuolar protein sorting-associated protein 26 n=1 Tax=Rozella allomycis (strain CSF55) TaxID=988480 RepID=A0A075AZ36_ROZAC|nr:Vacuolar protein sorting-associated protein 26 domain-containing protein [Rozella allomycis CSF55]RKP17821.1 vacuolar protein sorting-associated protein 26 [Rozella allomycis CSF55]|eukprot:EPZ35394.1 Vacuolar protein sorting-associated protein 26 domain-containing protein [Rozella allomycis CSF55]
MTSFFSFKPLAEVLIYFKEEKDQSQITVKQKENKYETLALFHDDDTLEGKVVIRLKDGKKLEHQGIDCELIGLIEYSFDKNNPTTFLSLHSEMAGPGELSHTQSFNFKFEKVEKPFESYNGIHVRLRYFVRVTVKRKLMADLIKEKDFWTHCYKNTTDLLGSIKMEVGIEDCLHIEFEYNKARYHLMDVIVGKIYFILIRIKIKHMELSIIRRESSGLAPNQYHENDTLTRFEIMDGAPVKGETIPIRLFLNGFDLTPTYREVNRRFSVRYYLNLVLVDEENRRYFKQQEIILFRSQENEENNLNARVANSKVLCEA